VIHFYLPWHHADPLVLAVPAFLVVPAVRVVQVCQWRR